MLVVRLSVFMQKPEAERCKRCVKVQAAVDAGRPAYRSLEPAALLPDPEELPKLTRHQALAVLDELQAIADECAGEYVPLNQNAFARLVLYRFIESIASRVPADERRQVDLFRYFGDP